MMYELQKKNLSKAVELLKKEHIDLWLIFTSEGSDPSLTYVTGVETVGPGAFLITRKGEKLVICSTIDAQDIRECNLFDDVRTYQGDLEEVLKGTIAELNPTKIAVNYSEEHPIADGLTVGRFRWLQEMLIPIYKGEFVSSENVLLRLQLSEQETAL
ncbi:aminopeptidase P family N-terminal domain-containing protein [Pseudalkalibacillus berkeleyi]|uniref:Aminopeptidase P family N-terminal domain-containing protein n=1 Tax=Pseudalkalibacillus berkeleyi TaxID=1069813 RepID=A0ABS9H089_9BACL|nr:aminopeptidase P family N-terminal domain-containing protein [Pseudalkalibacillus berkeleyi]MCF6138418.1 aminopeptidase P family N-terminal domain-containing protein [Pseudalkalibacillus berkeleyi]